MPFFVKPFILQMFWNKDFFHLFCKFIHPSMWLFSAIVEILIKRNTSLVQWIYILYFHDIFIIHNISLGQLYTQMCSRIKHFENYIFEDQKNVPYAPNEKRSVEIPENFKVFEAVPFGHQQWITQRKAQELRISEVNLEVQIVRDAKCEK